jgi:hypothetical protein
MEPTKDSANTAPTEIPTEEITSTETPEPDVPTSVATIATSASTTEPSAQAQRDAADNLAESLKRFKQLHETANRSRNQNCALVFAIVVGSIVLAIGLGTATQCAVCAAGAAILRNQGNADYVPLEGAAIGAIGGVIVTSSALIVSPFVACARNKLGLFESKDKDDKKNKTTTIPKMVLESLQAVTVAVISGMIGWGIMNAGENYTEMDFGQAVASSAVGATTILIPFNIIGFLLSQLTAYMQSNPEPVSKRCFGV